MNKKKTLRIALVALISFSCVLCGLSTAFAASNVTVTIASDQAVITFSNAEKDLFGEFKNLMPGDSREQEIQIINNTGGPMEVFLNAEPTREEDKAFLDQLTMEVFLKGNGLTTDALIASYGPETGSIADLGALGEKVSLGTITANATATLLVKLTVPTSLGNEFANGTYYVPWTFTVEDRYVPPYIPPIVVAPTPTPTPAPTPVPTETFEPEDIPTEIFEEDVPAAPPQTGDFAIPSALVAALAFAGLIAAAVALKKVKEI
ncbi:MAG: hypothetical protein ACOYIR_04540 [Christensenellales bacterium]|jgi:hypothetical protein